MKLKNAIKSFAKQNTPLIFESFKQSPSPTKKTFVSPIKFGKD